METIANWNGELIAVIKSKGGVLATVNPLDNLISTGISPWPTPEIGQKLYKSNQQRHFVGDEQEGAKSILGYYSDLQSLHSEDAITWSVFGPLVYASSDVREQFVSTLFEYLKIPCRSCNCPNIWLWRRYLTWSNKSRCFCKPLFSKAVVSQIPRGSCTP